VICFTQRNLIYDPSFIKTEYITQIIHYKVVIYIKTKYSNHLITYKTINLHQDLVFHSSDTLHNINFTTKLDVSLRYYLT